MKQKRPIFSSRRRRCPSRMSVACRIINLAVSEKSLAETHRMESLNKVSVDKEQINGFAHVHPFLIR